MTKIHVIAGGSSDERDVSLRSGAAVAKALADAGYTSEILDPVESDIAAIADCDAVFPMIHGRDGEDGALQAQLEAYGISYVGSDAIASKRCFDKWQYRQAMRKHHIRMAKGVLVSAENFTTQPLVKSPFVLKPVSGGSSIDTFIVRDANDVPLEAIMHALQKYGSMLLEQLIVGVELTVGILGDEPLPVIEIIPPTNGEFDYENKYNGKTQELCPPKNVSAAVQKRAQKLALRVHRAAGCRDLSRTDMIYEPNTDSLYVLETNTIPGMTAQSLYPKMSSDKTFSQLCDTLITFALNR